MTRYAKATDSNHAQIRDQLRKLGVFAWDCSAAGNGLLDLLCYARGRVVWLELKSPEQPPSRRKLTPLQQVFWDTYPGPKAVVTTLEQALVALGMTKEGPSTPGG